VEKAYLIVGLGNPGREYAQTRHNSGFMALDRFAERCGVGWKSEARFQARLARAEFKGIPLVLCEPQTYMNQSGIAVQATAAFFRVAVEQVIVVVDDADLAMGGIRLRAGGSSGGHHGLESIEQHLGTREFARLRIGIGRRAEGQREITEYVLGRFEKAELPLMEAVLERACEQLECWLTAGLAKAMNNFNGMINTPLVKES
jgi:peptidyl-tRNA hydrolase, PTH1 family